MFFCHTLCLKKCGGLSEKGEMSVVERKVDECLRILRTKLIPMFESWSRRESQRERQTKCRDKKVTVLMARREFTTENNPNHSLTNDLCVMMGCRPPVRLSMLDRLETLVSTQPDNWFRFLASDHPRRAIVFLVSLYNDCSWVPWIKQSGNTMKVFRDWKTEYEPKKACFSYPASGEVLMKVNPPKEWTDTACITFCEAWIWKVYAVIYGFVDDLLGDIDEDLAEFKKLLDVSCALSGYVVYKDLEWDPINLCQWDRSDALKAYRLVAPRLKILREAFEKGIATNVETFFTV